MVGKLKSMFLGLTGVLPDSTEVLSAEGSHRQYVRMTAGEKSLMGVVGTSADENRAFISMSAHFKSMGIPVPEVLAVSSDAMLYIQEDLGDRMLFSVLAKARVTGKYDEEACGLLERTIRELPRIQVLGARGFDFNNCYSEREFGERQVMFDLNYFKYCFLKVIGTEFKETLLEDDFERLSKDLCQVPSDGFLYRDFQSRNVMLVGSQPYFIDFQGGQKGPHQYDLASFVWQAKAAYPAALKERLVAAYIDALEEFEEVDEVQFRKELRRFVLFRTLQVLGAYGFRGLLEKKAHFIESIPYAIANLKELQDAPFEEYPYLNRVLTDMVSCWENRHPAGPSKAVPAGEIPELEVQVSSFSYKKGIPADDSANGGGYVFDCRSIHNPGRYEQYKQLAGMDREVITFLEEDGEILRFLEHVYGVVDPHVECFLRRGFSHIQVSFGCTGGQHRSVYCAESLARHLVEKYGIRVRLRHLEQHVDKLLGPFPVMEPDVTEPAGQV